MDSPYIPPGYYGTRDVARALHTSPGAVRNLVYRGRLRRAGGTERQPWFRAEDVARLLTERQARAAA
ncbi:helix-turn-helix domain-containing protein [Streptomyces mutabilis]|uniref:helix-turn-helix domain-containing protein n=1 Tax=Streptomyces mutabilis TaxID=67332 RepID=UPI0022BA14D5|nr:helix-turn-helix domain-containing protein [Streptomyces mutabilis]MCZ9352975.1 helix-turn-helix domain-containing protein [Streptomyces mutabilis]